MATKGRHSWQLIALVVGVMGCGAGGTAQAKGKAAASPPAEPPSARPGPATSAGPSAGPSADEGEDELPQLPPPDAPEGATGINTVPASASGATAPASRYAALDRSSCEAELGKRSIAYERVGEARGVIAPLRLKGPIAGVDFHSMLPAAQRKTSPYEIYDCRLVLALDDWARVLARHDVVEVVHYSVYRPPSAKAVLTGPGRRHTGALAIDAAIFKTRDGRTISVEKDFHGRIGSKPCGVGAASATGLPAPAVTLRQLVCEAADAQLFNVMLTPDYNWPHRNHFHLEVTAGARWTFVR
ncbi:MAG TPA: extensin family protein [Labilithrix sp.]|nr:extensin family protein [Labilithrix sp.]